MKNQAAESKSSSSSFLSSLQKRVRTFLGRSKSPQKRSPFFDLLLILLIFGAEFLSSLIGIHHSAIPPIQIASGIAFAVLHRNLRFLPFIFIGSFLSYAFRENYGFISSSLAAGALVLEAWFAIWVLDKILNGRFSFRRIRETFAFICLGCILPTFSGSVLRAVSYYITYPAARDEDFLHLVLRFWICGILGILIIAPVLMVWSRRQSMPTVRPTPAESVALVLGVILIGAFTIGPNPLATLRHFPFLIFPFLIWAAIRWGSRGAAFTTFLVSMLAVAALSITDGQGNLLHLNNSLFTIQAFLGILASTGLMLAAINGERQLVLHTLRDSEGRYRLLFDQNPQPMWVYKPDNLHIINANEAAFQCFEFPREEFLKLNMRQLLVDDSFAPSIERLRTLEKEPIHAQWRMKTKTAQILELGITAIPLVSRGSQTGLIVAEDLTEKVRATEALHASKQRLSLQHQQTALGVIEWDLNRRVISWNAAAEQIFGYTEAEITGKRAFDFLIPSHIRASIDTVWQNILANVSGQDNINENLTKKGDTIICEWFNSRLATRDGEIYGVISFTRDITEQSRTNALIRESEERFRNVVESSPLGIHIYELTENNELILTAANPASNNIWGTLNENILGKTIEDAFPSIANTDIPERYKRVASHGRAWSADHITYRDHSVAGTFEVTAFQTSPGKMVSMFLDVTERSRAEEALRLREKALESITQAILICDNLPASGMPIIYTNPAFETITGYSGKNILGRNWAILFGSETSNEDVSLLNKAILNRQATSLELTCHRKDNSTFQASISISPIHDKSSQVSHYVGVLTDISAIKKLEAQFRQSQKMEAIGRLAGGVAHDFNNLLTAILGYNDLVLSSLSPHQPVAENSREVQKAAQRAAALTSQLLAFSRQQNLKPRNVNLNDLVRGIEKMLSRLIGESIEMRVELEPDLHHIKAEPGQIEQVIMNLVINARDAMDASGLLTIKTHTVTLSENESVTLSDLSPGTYSALSVTDNGCGMSDEIKEHIFEPFFSTKEKGKGTGLGLATCYGIVRQSGGAIRLHSAPGEGSIFEILFPIIHESEQLPLANPTESRMPEGTEKILIVEDDSAVRLLSVSILNSLGYSITEAANGVEATEILKAHADSPFHLVITDVIMPQMGGRELAIWIRKNFPAVKILFTSGYVDASLPASQKSTPDPDLLEKPFTPSELALRVRLILDSTD